MAEPEGTKEVVIPVDTPVTLDVLKSVLASEREENQAAFVKVATAEIEKLRQPDRSVLDGVGGTTEHPEGERSDIRIARNQPTDPLYRRLHAGNPVLREYRNADLDHWMAYWVRGLTQKNREALRIADDKLAALSGRNQRATTLEGVLDVSDPTAILDGTGGHLLPQEMANIVMIARDEAAVLPGLVQPFQMTGPTLRIPTAAAVTSAMTAEGSTAAQGEPTFVTELLKAQKLQAFMKASVEMLADSPFNLVNVYTVRAGASIGAVEDVQICTSNGTAPNISEAIAGGNVAEATTTVLIYEDLVTLYFALGKAYRRNAVWLGNSVTLTLVSQLVDSQSRPVLSFPGSANVSTDVPGAIGTIFNKNVFEVPLADGTLLFGDVTGYAMGRRSNIEAAVSDQVDFASDLVNFKFTERFDGRITDDVAMKQMADLATVA